jgi:hypothetical protein
VVVCNESRGESFGCDTRQSISSLPSHSEMLSACLLCLEIPRFVCRSDIDKHRSMTSRYRFSYITSLHLQITSSCPHSCRTSKRSLQICDMLSACTRLQGRHGATYLNVEIWGSHQQTKTLPRLQVRIRLAVVARPWPNVSTILTPTS